MDAARQHAALSIDELFVRYFALGGIMPLNEFESFLSGDCLITAGDYDVLAHALNERFDLELGMNHPVPYQESL